MKANGKMDLKMETEHFIIAEVLSIIKGNGNVESLMVNIINCERKKRRNPHFVMFVNGLFFLTRIKVLGRCIIVKVN